MYSIKYAYEVYMEIQEMMICITPFLNVSKMLRFLFHLKMK